MSHIMEKTLASLPKLISQSFGGGKQNKVQGPTPLGQDVVNFMKTVHRARTKTQEAAIVNAELRVVEERLKHVDLSGSFSGVVRGAFTTALFCNLLGHDTSFLGIHSVKLSQLGKGYDKHVGYLCACLLLHRGHQMTVLMMSTIIRDLQSSHMGDNCLGLLAAGQLVETDHIPHILPAVCRLLKHSHLLVRTKAVHCLTALQQVAPDLIQPSLPGLVEQLVSKDPGELTALLNLYINLSISKPQDLFPLSESFLHILRAILAQAFSSSFTYRGIALPWLTISLVRLLGNLAALSSDLASNLAPVLEALLHRTRLGEPTSLAVLQETVLSSSKLKAGEDVETQARLLNLCSAAVGKLLSPDAPSNQRWQGLTMLTALARRRPAFAAHHQVVVVGCLSDLDPAIQGRTTALLHAMANNANAQAVTRKLLEQASGGLCDVNHQQNILQMVSDLAERFISDSSTYVQIYLETFLHPALTGQEQEIFIERVLSRMDSIVKKAKCLKDSASASKVEQESNLPLLIEDMFTLLADKQASKTIKSLAVHVLASLNSTTALAGHPAMETFLTVISSLIVPDKVGVDTQQVNLMLQPQENLSCNKNTNHGKIDDFTCSCIQAITKMVLAGGLSVESVKTWLLKLKTDVLQMNYLMRFYLEELEELVNMPSDVISKSSAAFTAGVSGMDLSLYFIDQLSVHHLLQGRERFKQQHKFPSDQISEFQDMKLSDDLASLDSSMHSLLQSPSNASSESSSAYKMPLRKNKWREDDEEEFMLVNVKDRERGTPQEGLDLFAGLYANKDYVNKSRLGSSMWSDYHSEDLSMNIGFNLHPFGLPHNKTHGQAAKWIDLDAETDVDSPNEGDMSSLSESECVTVTVEREGYPLSNYTHIGARSESFYYDSDLSKANVGLNSGLYEQTAQHEAMSASSTVDTLTDSDPES